MNINLVIILFFLGHWWLSLFFHTAFLHRYGSHKMYTMSPFMEKVFYFLTWFFQGSSYLIPRAYAVMHRMHHEYSDTKEDPHSPVFFKDVMGMMKHTRLIYNDFVTGKRVPDAKFDGDIPVWNAMDKFGDFWLTRILWIGVYSLIYGYFIFGLGASPFWLFLLPVHYLMGPVQGAFVNWCGHKYGYVSYDNGDQSHNTEPWGIFLLGELYQNNHHMFPTSANFASKWYEIDPVYPVLWVLDKAGLIHLVKAPKPAA